MLLCFARRPLPIPALMDAIAVEVEGKGRFARRKRFQDVTDVLEICVCVVTVDVSTEDETARIAHFSVQEYLESDRIKIQKASVFSLERQLRQLEIARICIVYLLDPEIAGAVVEFWNDQSLTKYASESWPFHYLESGTMGRNADHLILRLLTSELCTDGNWLLSSDIPKTLDPTRPLPILYPSPIYIALWLGFNQELRAHSSDFSIQYRTFRLLNQSSDGSNVETRASSSLDEVILRFALALIAATEYFPFETVYHNVGSQTVGDISQYNHALVQLAAALGSNNLVSELLNDGYDINGGHDESRLTPLQAALGHENMVCLLIREGADVNAYGLEGRITALHLAVIASSVKLVRLLIRAGADVNLATKDLETPLTLAVKWSSPEVVAMLLGSGADTSLRDRRGEHPLQIAARLGFFEMLHMLIDNGSINISQVVEALQTASSVGETYIVSILLENFPELSPSQLSGPLMEASAHGYSAIVKRLLHIPVDIDASAEEDFGNALHAASASGHGPIVQTLLDSGADVNLKSGYFSTALIAATVRGHAEIVSLLLRRGADVNASGSDEYPNALQVASSKGFRAIASMLKEAGAKLIEPQDVWLQERAWELKAMSIPFGRSATNKLPGPKKENAASE